MATSFGPLLSALRQRAASHSSAVESGPPETASTSTGNCSRPEKSCLASDCETDDASAVATLLFLGDVALHLRRGLRIFASDLGERGAGRLLLMQRRERLAEAQKRLRRLAGVRVFRRHRQEGFRRLTITLLLELAAHRRGKDRADEDAQSRAERPVPRQRYPAAARYGAGSGGAGAREPDGQRGAGRSRLDPLGGSRFVDCRERPGLCAVAARLRA